MKTGNIIALIFLPVLWVAMIIGCFELSGYVNMALYNSQLRGWHSFAATLISVAGCFWTVLFAFVTGGWLIVPSGKTRELYIVMIQGYSWDGEVVLATFNKDKAEKYEDADPNDYPEFKDICDCDSPWFKIETVEIDA